MRRADRLFQTVQLIRGRRLSTAAFLAQRLEVSERTVYRDIAQLQQQGVPIEGEAGVGYRMGAGFALPPLMFSEDEARAVLAAVRLAQDRLDPALADAAELAMGRILSVLPPAARTATESLALFAAGAPGPSAATQQNLQALREAIQARRKLCVDYVDLEQQRSQRVLRPLGCFYWGQVWTLGAWCEQRTAFRSFRVDRFERIQTLEQRFADEPGKTLAEFLRSAGARPARKGWTGV
ncbi:MAG TPA: YafY family protein [Pseudorhodoferax sp.]|jgi:predicted DNA-binding transcriptional regulator YafY|nr:YafY family protein [Pseudorhodoferax sp.]